MVVRRLRSLVNYIRERKRQATSPDGTLQSLAVGKSAWSCGAVVGASNPSCVMLVATTLAD